MSIWALTMAALFIIGASRPGGYLGKPITHPVTENEEKTPAPTPTVSTGINTLVGEEMQSAPVTVIETEEPTSPLDGDSFYMDTAMGKMLYYSQTDPRWADYAWGGVDPLNVYGCGPTTMAMLANAFGNSGLEVTPVTMADWCDRNGQHAPREGSNHSIVNRALTAYGLQVTSLQNHIEEPYIRTLLENGHILVALVGNGYFTENGHFLLLLGLNEDGTVNIADPVSLENTRTAFDLHFLIGELKTEATDDGSPLWCITKPY